MSDDCGNQGGRPAAHPGGDSAGHPDGHPAGHPGAHPGAARDWEPSGGEVRHDTFRHAYTGGGAPWDIGRPQPVMVAMEDAGTFGRRVLDVGCGTGENALFFASRGHEAHGIDAVQEAIDQARAKAAERGLTADFIVADVLTELPSTDLRVDAVTDVGFFHALSDEQRPRFVAGLARVLEPGGVYAMLCFSDRVPGAFGPRRVSEAEIRATFAVPEFRIRDIHPAELHSAVPQMPVVDANLAIIERL